MKLFKRRKKEIDEDLVLWKEYVSGSKMLFLFSSGFDKWDLSISQHGVNRAITVLIPPIHFKDETAIKNRIKELIIEHNYFCHIEVHYGISSNHHFSEAVTK